MTQFILSSLIKAEEIQYAVVKILLTPGVFLHLERNRGLRKVYHKVEYSSWNILYHQDKLSYILELYQNIQHKPCCFLDVGRTGEYHLNNLALRNISSYFIFIKFIKQENMLSRHATFLPFTVRLFVKMYTFLLLWLIKRLIRANFFH